MLKLQRLTDTATTPTYATHGSVAFDLHADLNGRKVKVYRKHPQCGEELTHITFMNGEAELRIPPHSRAIIPVGFAALLSSNWQMKIIPRSGNASKRGLTVLNSPGTIDSDYTGEIFVIVYNASNTVQVIKHSERIAQAEPAPVYQVRGIKVQDRKREAGDKGGLGSTGI